MIPSSHIDQSTQTAALSLPHWHLEVNYSMVEKSSGIPKSWFTPSSATSFLCEEALWASRYYLISLCLFYNCKMGVVIIAISLDCYTDSIRESMKSLSSVQFSSVTQSCPTLCDPMDRSTPGLPVHHQLPEFTQTHVHRVIDAIQPSHHLSSPSPPAPNPSQHQSFFQWVSSSHEVVKVLEFQL